MNADHERRIRALEAQLANLRSAGRPLGFVGARYMSNSGQNIPDITFTVVNFEDVDYDPMGLVTTGAGWVFTCPVAGIYRVTAMVTFTGTAAWAAGEAAEIDLHLSGATYSVLDRKDSWPAGTLNAMLVGGDEVECAAGDTLDVRVFQASGGALALFGFQTYNHIAISLVGSS